MLRALQQKGNLPFGFYFQFSFESDVSGFENVWFGFIQCLYEMTKAHQFVAINAHSRELGGGKPASVSLSLTLYFPLPAQPK